MASTHTIPFPAPSDHYLTGTLERKGRPDEPTAGRPIALILHGAMGHRDYLFQKSLAERLPIDSFRFDFRGNNDSPGPPWSISAFDQDVEDIRVAVAWLKREFGYRIDLVVGHSRGSIVSMKWIANSEEGRGVRGFVNVSGRYRMEKIHDRDAFYKPYFDKDGHYDWKVAVNRRPVTGRIFPKDVDAFGSYNTDYVNTQFPAGVHILTIHGLQDKVVPPYDAVIYAKIFSKRHPGTHTLHLMEQADHNFVGAGQRDEVNDTILDWWASLNAGTVKSGWAPIPIGHSKL